MSTPVAGEARERLVLAAVELFSERGYDDTTVAQIAERAGLTKSTFFRHFPDKRELLVAGQDTLSTLLADGASRRGRKTASETMAGLPPTHCAPWMTYEPRRPPSARAHRGGSY